MVTHSPHYSTSSDEPPVFRAISDGTRRAILDGLRRGGRTAGQIAGDFDISRPAVSRHLRVLERAGLVRAVKTGRRRQYDLAPEPLAQVDAWLARYRMFWAHRLVDLAEHAERLARADRDQNESMKG